MLTVMDVSKVVARVNMAQDQARNVKVGNEATITPADGGELVTGTVTIVSPASDPNSTTVQVWVQADNPGERLHAGQAVHVSIVAATLDGATLIPTPAVLPNAEGETIVLIVDDKNVAHEKVVQIGVREPEMVQIVAGVEVGAARRHAGRARARGQDEGARDEAGREGGRREGRSRRRGQELMSAEPNGEHWTARHGKPIIFVILTLVAVGVYLATTIPVAVFPGSRFPARRRRRRQRRGADRSDAGDRHPPDRRGGEQRARASSACSRSPAAAPRRSICSSRGTVDMFQTLQRVNAALARVQPELPATAKVTANRLTFAAFPIIGYSLTSDTVPQTRLWELATYDLKPRLNRMIGVSTVVVQGGQEPEFEVQPDPAKLLQTQITVPGAARRDRPQQPDRLAGPVRAQPPARAEPRQRPGAHRSRTSPTSS